MKPFLLVASTPRPLKFRYKNAAEADVPNVLCFRFPLILSWKKKKKKNNERKNFLAIAVQYLGSVGFPVLLENSSWEVLGGVCAGSQATNPHRLHHLESAEVVNKCWLGGCSNKEGGRKYITDFGFLQNPPKLKYEQILWDFYHEQIFLDRHRCLAWHRAAWEWAPGSQEVLSADGKVWAADRIAAKRPWKENIPLLRKQEF